MSVVKRWSGAMRDWLRDIDVGGRERYALPLRENDSREEPTAGARFPYIRPKQRRNSRA